MSTHYIDFYEINELQHNIMVVVDHWVREKKTPIPHHEIIVEMKRQGIKDFTTVNAIGSLLKKGFIRRAVVVSNKSFYVMLRSV